LVLDEGDVFVVLVFVNVEFGPRSAFDLAVKPSPHTRHNKHPMWEHQQHNITNRAASAVSSKQKKAPGRETTGVKAVFQFSVVEKHSHPVTPAVFHRTHPLFALQSTST
jgi:hypothetical protein